MKLVLGKLLLLVCVLLPSMAFAQRAGSEVTAGADRFSKAALAIWNWVRVFDTDADKFVAKENQRQLVQHLRDMNESLYSVEAAKRSLVYEMEHTTGTPAEMRRMDRMVVDLVTKVHDLKDKIGGVASLLREQQKAGGQDCEALLTEAIMTRKEWVSRLATNPELLRDPSTRAQLIESGEAAVKALRGASIELSNVITRLSSATS